ALWVALPIRVFQLAFAPALWLLGRTSAATLRLLGVTAETSGDLAHSEEELRMLLAESHRVGALSGQKRELLENVIDYTERTARHVMIPRADIAYLSLAQPLEENLAVITRTAHTRFPLASSDIDHVVGGLTPIDDAAERLQVELPRPGDVSTLGGLVTARIGRIPRRGDQVALPGYELRVMEMKGRRVGKVLAVAVPEAQADAAAGRGH